LKIENYIAVSYAIIGTY